MRQYLNYRSFVLIAVLFHAIGFVGIGLLHLPLVLRATPLHLLLMFLLLVLSFPAKEHKARLWLLATVLAGFAAEWLGVHTGWLFGQYRYGTVLGPCWQGIPLLIGCNWVLLLSGACSLAGTFFTGRRIMVLVAALLATACDWILEPVAVRLGYWHWKEGVSWYNYACWFGLALLLAALWQRWKIRPGSFALTLLIVQVLFFLLLRLTL